MYNFFGFLIHDLLVFKITFSFDLNFNGFVFCWSSHLLVVAILMLPFGTFWSFVWNILIFIVIIIGPLFLLIFRLVIIITPICSLIFLIIFIKFHFWFTFDSGFTEYVSTTMRVCMLTQSMRDKLGFGLMFGLTFWTKMRTADPPYISNKRENQLKRTKRRTKEERRMFKTAMIAKKRRNEKLPGGPSGYPSFPLSPSSCFPASAAGERNPGQVPEFLYRRNASSGEGHPRLMSAC